VKAAAVEKRTTLKRERVIVDAADVEESMKAVI
jgi:hypothetical protein